MDFNEVMTTLEGLGSEQSKKVLSKHGAKEPFFGAKIADVKKEIVRKVKKNYELSLQLYNSGNSDAMYLAALISEPEKMSKEQLQDWMEKAYWYYLSEYAVAWTTAESRYGWELALEWIESKSENIAAGGWGTLSSLVTITPDDELPMEKLEQLLHYIETNIHSAQNRVRHTMNGFVIATGSCVVPLNIKVKEIAKSIGKVSVEMGGTSCKVPFAPDYIKKVEDKGKLGNKKKRAIC